MRVDIHKFHYVNLANDNLYYNIIIIGLLILIIYQCNYIFIIRVIVIR